jgi:hypothetical protein
LKTEPIPVDDGDHADRPVQQDGSLMGCLAALAVLALPRFVMVMLWIFTNYLSRAYDGWLLPLLGFFFLPTTTLAYAVAQHETNGFRSWGAVLVVLGVLLDLGSIGRGRGAFKRD